MSVLVAPSVVLQTGKVVTTASSDSAGRKFLLKVEKRTMNLVECIEADYLLIASGSSQQVWLILVHFHY